jgi:drug/metabolite transporter (DMT)-like permease
MSFDTFRLSALGGVGFGLQAVLLYTALKRTSVVSAVVITSLQPLMLIPMTRRIFAEVMVRRRLGLVLLAIVGTVIVVAGSSGGGRWSLGGDLLALGATLAGCGYFIGTKAARAHLHPLEYQSAALVWGVLFGAPAAAILAGGLTAPRPSQWIWPVAMTAIAGSGHLLMNAAQRHVSVGTTSTLALAVGPVTALGAVLIYDEPISAVQVLGMVVVLAALGAFASDIPMNRPASAEESAA